MVIYEVNLSINLKIYPKFNKWLKVHINELLELPGFRGAILYKLEPPQTGQKNLCVHYQVSTMNDLQNYFDNHAKRFREKGIKQFENQFTANRRILEKKYKIP